MNRRRALCKNHSWLVTVALSLGLSACASPESFQAKAVANFEGNPSSRPKQNASLITEEHLQKFPHLRPHDGQILLAQETLQAIVPGMPFLPEISLQYALVSHIYRLQGRNWQTSPWLPLPEISLKSEDGRSLKLVGRDLEQGPEGMGVVSIFRSSTAPTLEARVSLHFVPETNIVEVAVQSVGGQALEWELHLSRGIGEEWAIPFEGETIAGMTIALLPDLFSLVSSVPLTRTTTRSEIQLKTLKPNAQSAFYLLLDKPAFQVQAQLVAQAISCYALDDKAQSINCLGKAWNPTSVWNISQANKTRARGEKKLMRPLYLHTSEGSFRSLIPIHEGEQIKIGLSTLETLELFYPDAEGALQHNKPEGPVQRLELPEIQRGTLQIDLKPPETSFIEIRDAVHKDGFSLQSWLGLRPLQQISPHALLQKTWPFFAPIPAGDYQVQVFNGTRILCQQNIAIRSGKKVQISCLLEGNEPDLSPRVHLSLDANRHSKELIAAARLQVSGRSLRAGSGDTSVRETEMNLKEMPIIEVADSKLGLSLKAFPADESIRSAWNAALSQSGSSGHRFHDFLKFARSPTHPLQVILECPPPGFPPEEYAWNVLTFDVDYLEIFGCQQPEQTQELFSLAQRLQQKSRKPVQFMAASPYRSLFPLHGQIPALYVPALNARDNPPTITDLAQILKRGAYTLGLRSEIELPAPSQAGTVAVEDGVIHIKIRSYDLKRLPGLLRIHDEFEMLTEWPIPSGTETSFDFKVPFKRQARSHWLRIELLGQDFKADEGAPPFFMLATTNFLRLDETP